MKNPATAENTTSSGTSFNDPASTSLDSGVIIAIVLPPVLIVIVASAMIYRCRIRRKQQRQVTLTMRRAHRIKRLDVLHIDVEYSNTACDASVSDRLSHEGYANLCNDFCSDQNLQIREITNTSPDDCYQSNSSSCDIMESERSALREVKESDGIISNYLNEVSNEIFIVSKYRQESRNDEEAMPVPPVRFDFETSSSFGPENEISSSARREDKTAGHVCTDESTLSTTLESPVCKSDDKRVDTSNDQASADNDRESLIERQQITSFENQVMDDTE